MVFSFDKGDDDGIVNVEVSSLYVIWNVYFIDIG